MKKLMTAAAAFALFAGIGMSGANAATRLTDSQLDRVTAGDGGFTLLYATAEGGAHVVFGGVKSDQTAVATRHFAAANSYEAAWGYHASAGGSATAATVTIH